MTHPIWSAYSAIYDALKNDPALTEMAGGVFSSIADSSSGGAYIVLDDTTADENAVFQGQRHRGTEFINFWGRDKKEAFDLFIEGYRVLHRVNLTSGGVTIRGKLSLSSCHMDEDRASWLAAAYFTWSVI